jgi:hypothetical protein
MYIYIYISVFLVEGELVSSCFQLMTNDKGWKMCYCWVYLFDSKIGVFDKRHVIIAIILNWLIHVEL